MAKITGTVKVARTEQAVTYANKMPAHKSGAFTIAKLTPKQAEFTVAYGDDKVGCAADVRAMAYSVMRDVGDAPEFKFNLSEEA